MSIVSFSTGAIERHKLERPEKGERTEPQISFRAFVEELDTGDSFTTTLVDILVRVRAIMQQSARHVLINEEYRNLRIGG